MAPRPDRVQDDLNRESLPQSQRDPSRKIAWANAICATVLGIGIFLRRDAQQFYFKPEMVESAPVVIPEFVPEPPPQVEQVAEDKPEEQTEAAVVPVVVAPDASKVNFAVPVTGPTVKATDFRYAAPPPRVTQRSGQSGPKVIHAGDSGDGGIYPQPDYPHEALVRRETGSGEVYIEVDAEGVATKVEIRVTSGSATLDRAALAAVRKKWKFPPGAVRSFTWPFEFTMK